MAKIGFDIIATGSSGNAVVIENSILIDCGVPYRSLAERLRSFNLVLLTHIHADHFKKQTISRMAKTRPTLRFGVPEYMVSDAVSAGIAKRQIDLIRHGETYQYGKFSVEAFDLLHNVPQTGYKIFFPDGRKMIYATDTSSLDGVSAEDYDLYMIEANHTEKDIHDRIKAKALNGEYAYETEAAKNHLSEEKAIDWIYRNIGSKGEYVLLHRHTEKGS
jgi:phosphoribosyl 1,2-cyclic phosphodiesterase